MSFKPAAAAAGVPARSQALHTSSPTLGFDAGPLVWIDLEMTGLDARTDDIMEIAVIITDGNLTPVDDGIEYVVKVDRERLDRMDEWCTRQHGSTGLTQACLASSNTLSSVESMVLDYVQKYIPERKVGVLAGNSVHVDRMFLSERMPRLLEYLHYRTSKDVSSIKELCRRWYNGSVAPPMVSENNAHRALDDIRGSIKELQWYREHIFVSPESFKFSGTPPSSTESH
ncbi:ribonuclease H-like protein [Fomitiporia mediterranea MF3/22]|uniref:ribonuclease H-like protein n=1 Tax=Fomitiporia mediterranea (strain MF3/22) TaxID=694068 RepID=UPI0004407467|nr:ribonuclease H-like protein [Fomitiporia mediterranea MF3/22]EJD08137.1 ribonuclease H-like protein [Fomitiporia mediterranea MF3/22]